MSDDQEILDMLSETQDLDDWDDQWRALTILASIRSAGFDIVKVAP
jgi:hypothetical protein